MLLLYSWYHIIWIIWVYVYGISLFYIIVYYSTTKPWCPLMMSWCLFLLLLLRSRLRFYAPQIISYHRNSVQYGLPTVYSTTTELRIVITRTLTYRRFQKAKPHKTLAFFGPRLPLNPKWEWLAYIYGAIWRPDAIGFKMVVFPKLSHMTPCQSSAAVVRCLWRALGPSALCSQMQKMVQVGSTAMKPTTESLIRGAHHTVFRIRRLYIS